ncbi:hypothetical protein H5410_014877 [Solanum commersonii]|uniref:Uncharacterized protein n=1 Tax=Solanum commersonii TaxID=4109 RepID=A0A9J5ZS24_SOLCO|nr:hypothetical protein H5410_014877 [Solanum commersonii]
MVHHMRSRMILFVVGLSHLSSKEGRAMMLIGDMVISRLMVYVQQVEEEKLRDREEFKNKKAKTGNESGQQKSNANRSSVQQKQNGLAPSSSSVPAPKNKELNGNESYYSGGEYKRNVEHNSYGEDRGEESSCGSSYDDDGACERSYSHSEIDGGSYDDARTCYTSHSQDEGNVKYNTLLYKKYEEHATKACEDS